MSQGKTGTRTKPAAACQAAVIALLLLAGISPAASPGPVDTLLATARRSMQQGDVGRALEALESILEHDPDNARALLARGRVYLDLGDTDRAMRDLRRASFDSDPAVRAGAHIGLGDCYRLKPFRKFDAARHYRFALRADSTSREALYKLAQTGFALRETQGYRMAARALAELVCLDPGYSDAYRVWRDSILDKTREELQRTGRAVEQWLARNPDPELRRLDLARDRFELGSPAGALEILGELDRDPLAGRLSERLLLRAACLLELGDTTGFELAYNAAMDSAGSAADFSRVLLEAETIFTPEEAARYETLDSLGQVRSFWRSFWKKRDPDPLTQRNERLVEHYRRLHHAREWYRMNFPHSRFQSSRDYFLLMSPASFSYNYEPEVFFRRGRKLTIDQRGLMYLRHGPPDKVISQVTWEDPMEIWYYGSVKFLFEKKAGCGDFVYTPSIAPGSGDMMKAMAGESFVDPLPELELDFFAADFLGPEGGIEYEFYQSAPAGGLAPESTVSGVLGIFDSTWAELGRDTREALLTVSGADSLWQGMNSLHCPPGEYLFALSMSVPGHRAVARGSLTAEPLRDDLLELSGIVLGSEPVAGSRPHRRMGVSFIPRPSLEFTRGEKALVYLEVYGLDEPGRGGRSFREMVTVKSLGSSGPGFWSRLGRVFGLGNVAGESLTLSFDRQPGGVSGEAVAESFTLDTGNLAPGEYRLVVDVRDNSDGRHAVRAREFKVKDR